MNFLLLAAAAVQPFNLNCTGKLTEYPNWTKPFSLVYRVDLSQKKWCEGDCRRTFDFVEISPSRLTLSRERTYTVSGENFIITYIDRVTGEYKSFSVVYKTRYSIDTRKEWSGQCERAPFTGLPPVVPKF